MTNVNVEKGKQGFQPRPKGEAAAADLDPEVTVGGLSYVRAEESQYDVSGPVASAWATHKVDGRDFEVAIDYIVVAHDDGTATVGEYLRWGYTDQSGKGSDENMLRGLGQHDFGSLAAAIEEQGEMLRNIGIDNLDVDSWMIDDPWTVDDTLPNND